MVAEPAESPLPALDPNVEAGSHVRNFRLRKTKNGIPPVEGCRFSFFFRVNSPEKRTAVFLEEFGIVDISETVCYNSVTFFLIEVIILANKSAALEYKGHALRRKDNIIYFGSMSDKYIIMLQILDTKKVKDLDVATRVSIQLQLTDPELKSRDRVVKKTEKGSLYAAMDVASVWLDRALASK